MVMVEDEDENENRTYKNINVGETLVNTLEEGFSVGDNIFRLYQLQ